MRIEHLVGLDEREAAKRLREYGPNELASERKNTFKIFLSVIREPMLLLLLVAASIYAILGESSEAILLLGSALLVIAINIVQDVRSSRAVQALKELTSPRVRVVRSGSEQKIPSRELVPGDIMLLSEGDRVCGDAALLTAMNFMTDESLLTGESLPVPKTPWDEVAGNAVEESNKVFSGSLVVDGTASTRVLHTGSLTEIGKIGKALSSIETGKTPLEAQTAALVRRLAIAGLAACVIVVFAYHSLRGGWMPAILAGIALAMALLPEEFPVVLSVFLALGAKKLSNFGILVRRLSAVEALGTVTTLCVDKTGTITKNEMSLIEIATPMGGIHTSRDLTDEAALGLLQAAWYSSRPNSFDPMDKAVLALANEKEAIIAGDSLLDQFPITPECPALTQVWQSGEEIVAAIKGAPETVLAVSKISSEAREGVQQTITAWAARGLRVLAVAMARGDRQETDRNAYPFQFLGLLAFADPIRDGIPEAVRECYAAGIRIVMITGDHPETARAIAEQAGIANAEVVVTGRELREAPEESLPRLLRANVFARVAPTQKLAIVQALQKAGEIAVMTGDGVNDAPALKAADIGVAMGGRGTDVAREAAAVVLTHDDFPSLVMAVRLGRKTYDNIKKAMYYVIAVHVPIAGLALIPLLFGTAIILQPIHIVLLELLIDPMSTLVFQSEGEEHDVMNRAPRDPRVPIFQRSSIVLAFAQGISILLVCSLIYFWGNRTSPVEARTLAFVTLIISNLCLALVNRSWSMVFWETLRIPNRSLWIVIGLGLAVIAAITQVPALASLFEFGPFHLHDWLYCSLAAAFGLTWFELLKLASHRKLRI
ncbi:MAG TPA: cation-translocating P-type ATPase [Candidatus Kapabacteria bacterium]|nr:cation-translocating P-type ATPase [Candidatus Kapabacteria bacterium]